MSGPSNPAPGWYPDPQDTAQQRYWDGAAWSEATQPISFGGPTGPTGPYGQQVGYGYAQGTAGVGVPAGFGMRFLAVFLDGLILGIPFALLGAAFIDTDDASFRVGVGYTPGIPLGLNLLQIAVSLAYYGVLIGGKDGQTLGKRACGIRVVDAASWQPGVGVGRGIGRFLATYLSAIPCLLGYFWMLWDADKQTWHDKLANTRVVKA